jgi:hypothetical protein
MKIKLKWSIAAYVVIAIYVALSNLPMDSTTTEIKATNLPAMTGRNIPAAYLASLPAVAENRGVAPPHVLDASVTAYVVESHRGWPWRIEDKYGYRYDIFDTGTGYAATLAGFTKKSGLNFLHLIVNFLGPLAALVTLHFSASLAARSNPFLGSTVLRTQTGG